MATLKYMPIDILSLFLGSKQVRDLKATVTPRTGLTDGQVVTVKWSGFTPGATINIVQCSSHVPGDATACDLKTGKILQPNPTGSGSLPLDIVVGPVGNGICDAAHPVCDVVVNDGGSLDPAANRLIAAALPETSEKVVRGGSWNNQKELLRVYTRGSQPADWCTAQLGFRPAATIP